MSRVYKQPRPESNKKATPVTETKDTGSAGKGKKNTEVKEACCGDIVAIGKMEKNTEKVEEGGE